MKTTSKRLKALPHVFHFCKERYESPNYHKLNTKEQRRIISKFLDQYRQKQIRAKIYMAIDLIFLFPDSTILQLAKPYLLEEEYFKRKLIVAFHTVWNKDLKKVADFIEVGEKRQEK